MLPHRILFLLYDRCGSIGLHFNNNHPQAYIQEHFANLPNLLSFSLEEFRKHPMPSKPSVCWQAQSLCLWRLYDCLRLKSKLPVINAWRWFGLCGKSGGRGSLGGKLIDANLLGNTRKPFGFARKSAWARLRVTPRRCWYLCRSSRRPVSCPVHRISGRICRRRTHRQTSCPKKPGLQKGRVLTIAASF